jgi:hypothetical protein
MAATSHVFAIAHVAQMVGEDEDWLQDISIEMDPEDGRIAVWVNGDEAITAFTERGVENLAHIIKIYKANPELMARSSKAD